MLDTEHWSMSCPENISLKIINMKSKHMQYLFILLPNGFHRITVSKDLTLSLSFSTFLSLFNPIYIFFLHGNPLKRNSAWGSLNKRHKKEIFPIPSVGVFVFLESENKYKLLIKQIKKVNN